MAGDGPAGDARGALRCACGRFHFRVASRLLAGEADFMYGPANSARRIRTEDLHVDAEAHPDWVSGLDRVPAAGEEVFCTGGMAEVVRLLGRTGDGSRLLELRLLDGKHPPFFVAASNVRVAPRQKQSAK
jgi:hypothetical protein